MRGFFLQKRSQKRIQSSLEVGVMVVRSTNPEDRIRRIRDLYARAAATEDADEIKKIASQLRKELDEQTAYLKEMVAVHRGIAWEAESDESRVSE
jgi:DNA polymerase III delta prime subunit